MNVKSGKRTLIDFWLAGIVTALSFALVLTAALVGQGMGKRVIALLATPTGLNWEIYLLEADRGLQQALTRDNNRYGFMWSPDGQEIGFTSDVTGFTVMDWTGHNRRPMAESDTWLIPFARGLTSFDNEWNTSNTERVLSGSYEIYICDMDCAHRQQITTDGYYFDVSPSWSPDGHQIVFASDRGGSYLEIFVMNRDGTAIHQLTRNSHFDNLTPDWSADGRQIAFVGILRSNDEVFVMDADGQHVRRLTYNHMPDTYPAWQPEN